jgi:drug/metabolite transporter (DMT)-like permease
MHPHRLGIVLVMAGMFLFALNDTLGKYMVAGYSVGLLMAVRSVAGGSLLFPFLWRERNDGVFRAMFKRKVLLRAFFATADSFCFYAALMTIPVADMMVIYMAAPIITTAMAPFMLGEHVGWRRWTAVGIGFVGVLIALNPTGNMVMPGALIALIGAIGFALNMVVTRQLKGESGFTLMGSQMLVSLAVAVLGVLLTLAFPQSDVLQRLAGWVVAPPLDFALLALLGIVATTAFFFVNYALKIAPATVVVPFQYSAILWASLFGYLAFGDFPAANVQLGCVVIVAAGLYIFFREQSLSARVQA